MGGVSVDFPNVIAIFQPMHGVIQTPVEKGEYCEDASTHRWKKQADVRNGEQMWKKGDPAWSQAPESARSGRHWRLVEWAGID